MKIAGAVIVVAVFTLLGMSRAAGLSKRARCLGAVIESLRYIMSELRSVSTPLPEIFYKLEEVSRPETKKFFQVLCGGMASLEDRSFGEIWREALREGGLCLSEGQLTELNRLGLSLGRYSAEEQCSALSACMTRLEAEYGAAMQRSREGRKLYTGLGLATGIMLAAVLI